MFQYAPTFNEFEDWILTTAGQPDKDKTAQFNAFFSSEKTTDNSLAKEKLLTTDDWAFWQQMVISLSGTR